MAHYYGYCEVHGRIGNRYDDAELPDAKDLAWEDCRNHIENVDGTHGEVAPKRSSFMILPNGKKSYKYAFLNTEENPFKIATSKKVFKPRKIESLPKCSETELHIYKKTNVCLTDSKGYATPKNISPFEIVLDASEGFVPLWSENVVLRWRFNTDSMLYFENPDLAKNTIRDLFREALMKWGDAAPIKFAEREDAWDFEIAVRSADNCNTYGCTLASAFFPDSGRHKLEIYPKMFTQSRKEQLDTLIHETGHIFGLRHFFANVSETKWPSEIYGKHAPFSIMNYGHKSELTEDDKTDLKSLYEKVWSGDLKNINGTPIVLVKPYHQLL